MVQDMARVFKRSEDVVYRAIAGESLLIPIRAKLADLHDIFALNPAGDMIWSLLDGQRSLEDILDRILDRFEVGREEAREDLRSFIKQLLNAGAIMEVL